MENFTNQTIDLDNLPQYQTTPLTLPHPKYWTVMVINIVIFLAVIGVGLATFMVINENVKEMMFAWIGFYVLFIGLLFFIYRASFKRRGFALREKDILYKSGLIAETTTIVPLNRIQHVALKEGFLSRIFGLGTLEIFTAGGNSGHMHIAGIEIEKAKVIKEALVKRIDIIINPANEA